MAEFISVDAYRVASFIGRSPVSIHDVVDDLSSETGEAWTIHRVREAVDDIRFTFPGIYCHADDIAFQCPRRAWTQKSKAMFRLMQIAVEARKINERRQLFLFQASQA